MHWGKNGGLTKSVGIIGIGGQVVGEKTRMEKIQPF